MDQDEENIQTLLSMGFCDIKEIKRALRISRNDLSEAVTILTSEPDSAYLCDVEMRDAPNSMALVPSNSSAPPPYDTIIGPENAPPNWPKDEKQQRLEFPTTNLYELESRVFPDAWSIPYKKEESLGKCLISATEFAYEALCEADDNCKRFIEHCMPEAFKKLLTSGAVRSWGLDVQEGVYNMLQLLIDFVAARLRYDPVPERLLSIVLSMAFDRHSEFHLKNKHRSPTSAHLLQAVNRDQVFASPSSISTEPYGWLVSLINNFGQQDGFTEIKSKFDGQLTISAMASLLIPLAKCADFLNPEKLCPLLNGCMQKAVDAVQNLTYNDFKNKNIASVSELLRAMKQLCAKLWPEQGESMSILRQGVVLRMLRCPHFNARMNGLKEVVKLIDDKESEDSEALLDWLADNKVLSIALEGNIDQVQYTDKIKGIMEFLGPRLSLEELTKIWNMQDDQNFQTVDNIHAIMAAASAKFSTLQFDHLLHLLQKSWDNGNDQTRRQLLKFCGWIGKETGQGKISTKVLDLLWEFTHVPQLPIPLVELALQEHIGILNEASHKDQTKKSYLLKCVEDIKKGSSILLSLKYLHNLSAQILKSGQYKQDKAAIHDLNKAHDLLKLATSSLSRCHKQSTVSAPAGEQLPASSVILDKRYDHEEYIVAHLEFLKFLLQEGSQYLSWNRAKEIWETLVISPESCNADRELCFTWFDKCLQDLEGDTQLQLFQQKLLKLDPAQLTLQGFTCFRTYFESVNIAEHKLRKSVGSVIVEKMDLIGLDFLWAVALSSANEKIADTAIDMLLNFSYHCLSPKLKKDQVVLHKRFISECYKRLEAVVEIVGVTAVTAAVSNATKTLTAISVAEVAALPPPTRTARLQSIRRLLQTAERYISSIEELHTAPRTILPHGASFLGFPCILRILYEAGKEEFVVQSHSNESLHAVKLKIAQSLQVTVEQIQLFLEDNVITSSSDRKLLGQLDFNEQQTIVLKLSTCSSSVVINTMQAQTSVIAEGDSPLSFQGDIASNVACSSSNHQLFLQEQEKLLPGVVMSLGGQVFEMLYQLASLEDPRITDKVRSLLQLIPTDPAIHDALDSITIKNPQDVPPSFQEGSSKQSPRSSPKRTTPSKDILQALFDIRLRDITPFRLLYNLEVLSGKLFPTMQDASLASAHSFGQDFLASGGLKLILGILHKDSIPSEAEYTLRQGCYYLTMQIARYLLCDEHLCPFTRVIRSFMPEKPLEKFKKPPAIKGLTEPEVVDIVQCIVRIAWAAAAGQLQLANSVLPIKDHHLTGRRSRQSSTGSSGSSESGTEGGLHGGVCSQQETIKDMDARLAEEILHFLVICLEMQKEEFNPLTNLPCASDFLIDVLLGSPSPRVRCAARHHLGRLGFFLHLRHFLLQVFLKVPLPLWIPSSSARGTNQRLLGQCKEYFELVCSMLFGTTVTEQTLLNIKPQEMIGDEVAWLQAFTTSDNPTLQQADNALLTGHFNLVKSLLTCEGVDKVQAGKTLIPHLLNQFLFPASHLISGGHTTLVQSVPTRRPTQESCIAAFEVLIELSLGCFENVGLVVGRLLSMHHYSKPELAKEHEYEPLVAERSPCGYVGLKNAGATCYMNAVIQQLYLQPGIREAILAVDENSNDDDSLFDQVQLMFGHLMESQLQYHVPEKFWRCFRLWGQPINVRDQQDAFEFFTHLIDQLDEHLRSANREPVFGPRYEGIFCDQKICQGCPHRYEREETFMALNLPVKTHNLIDSLDQFVKGELLEGDNAYFCEKCGEKRNTIKRTCIKTLPSVLVIQLKRFGYDWEANRAMKFDDYFKFPWILDMTPYTVEGVHENPVAGEHSPGGAFRLSNYLYELVGVVVHSGQANAGHYYSYIKERRNEGGNKGKWFKFNDTTVEEYEMTDASLEGECFGGTYSAKVGDSGNSYPETRQRYWNGYMLFYELMEDQRTPRTPRKVANKFSFRRSDSSRAPRKSPQMKQRDSLSQLTQLVDRGEKHGLFVDQIPARIQRVVREENLRFMHNRDVYSDTYFAFIQQLVSLNMENKTMKCYHKVMVRSVELSVNFLFNTYLRYKRKLNETLHKWVDCIQGILSNSEESVLWLMDFLASDVGLSSLKPFLLESPDRESRQVFACLLEKTFIRFFDGCGTIDSPCMDRIISRLVEMLESEVSDNYRTCSNYFWLLSMYVQMGISCCDHLHKKNVFGKLLSFLLGAASADMNSIEVHPRRWSSVQTRDFGHVHSTMATLVMSCNIEPHRTCDPEKFPIRISQWSPEQPYLAMPSEVSAALYSLGAFRYIQEVVSACREVSGPIAIPVDMLVQCCFCNEEFSTIVLKQVMLQYSTVPSNELRNLSLLLLDILLLEDPLQFKRLQSAIDGYTDRNSTDIDGILAIIRINQNNDSRRSYQGVKFLVTLAHKCQLAKDYLMQTPGKWQWAVNWLKKMMSGHTYWNAATVPLSNDDSNTKTFQRTVSAQDTLAEATALLTELESPDNPDAGDANMDLDEEEGEEGKLKRTQGMDDLDSIDH